MGRGRWDPNEWAGYTSSKSYATKTTAEIFTKRTIDPSLDPKGVTVRESCDSPDNPQSEALAVALDVTGSMDPVIDAMAREGLNTLVKGVYDRKPIHDPHVMIMGIGDADYDQYPLQATQFEADIRIAEQLEKLFIERGGGGNSCESYAFAWYFMAHHTRTDNYDKRHKKNYLFTVGDEQPTQHLTASHIEKVLGYRPQADVDLDALLTLVSRQWEVFHLIVAQGDYARTHADIVRKAWTKLLGEHAIWLDDHTKMSEVIISIMQIREGTDAKTVADSWDGTTALVVRNATAGLTKRSDATSSIVTL